MGLADRIESAFLRLRGHTVIRAAVVYASASFLLLQVLDLFGISTPGIRAAGAALAVGFVVGAGVYVGRAYRSQAPRRVAPRGGRVGALLGGRRWAVAAGVLLLLGAGAWRLGARLVRSPVRPGADVIAVLPFVTAGGDLDELGVGMVSLLTANFDQVGGIRAIDAGTVLHGWKRRAGDGSLDLEGALQVGRDVGAGAILWGSAAAVRDAIQATAELYTVDGERVAHEEVRGDIDDLHALVDRLTVAVLREIWRDDAPLPDLRIGAITTESPRALRAYLQGQRHLRAARYDSAIAALRGAVADDSTFALAHFHLAEACGWAEGHGSQCALRATEAATRFGERLPERERALLTAHLLHERGDFAARDSLEAITRRHPDDALAWYMLGDVIYHARPLIAPTAEELTAPFRRAVELDPTLSNGMVHLLDEAIFTGDRAMFDEFLGYYRKAVSPPTVERWESLARLRWAPPDSVGAVADDILSNAGRTDVAWLGPRMQAVFTWRFAKEMALDPAHLVAGLESTGPDLPWYLPVMRLRPQLLASLGRAREGSRWLDTLARIDPTAQPPWFVRIFWGVHGVLPPDSVAPALAVLARDTVWYVGDAMRIHHLGRGDVRAAETVRLAPLPPDTAPGAATPRGIRAAVNAWLTLARGDTAAGLAAMEQAIRQAGYSLDAIQPITSGPLQAYAEALARQPARREEGLRLLRGMLALGNVYTVPAYFAIAEALEAAGDRAGAAEAYGHIVRLWANADPDLQPRVERARRELARLAGEGGSGGGR